MNVSIEVFKVLAAVADHWPGERGHRLRRNFDWPGREKFIVRNHNESSADFADLRRLFLLLDEADVATSFQSGDFDFLEILGGGA